MAAGPVHARCSLALSDEGGPTCAGPIEPAEAISLVPIASAIIRANRQLRRSVLGRIAVAFAREQPPIVGIFTGASVNIPLC